MLPGMDIAQADPTALADRRLAWLEQRQRVLAQNVAHADTPGYQARDVAPFAQRLRQAMAATHPQHQGGGAAVIRTREDRTAGERTPNGNGVSLDDQALRIAETDQQHALAMQLSRKYDSFFRLALGRSG